MSFLLLASSSPMHGVVLRHDRPLSRTLELGGRFPLVQSETGELVFGFTVAAESPHRLVSISLSY